MSTIQDDKEIARQRKKLKDIDAPLRDQIPSKLLKKLQEDETVLRIHKMWEMGDAMRADWLERQRAYLADWDEFITPDIQGPFEQSSNIHLPMPFIVAKTYHARMLQALNAVEPTALPRRADAVERSKVVSELMSYTLDEWANEHQGVAEVLDTWVWDWCTTGVGLLKWNWDVKYVKYVDVVTEAQLELPTFTTDEAGNDVAIPNTSTVEREKEVVRKLFDGPSLSRVNIEDVVILGGEGDPQRADAVMQKQWLTASELWTLVDRKIFDEEAVEKIIQSGSDTKDAATNGDLKQQRTNNSGISQVDTDADLDRYEILESYVRLDVDGSGINSDIVTWSHRASNQLCRATYLHRINRAGERPFIKIDFFKRPGQTYGMGLIEVLYPLSRELDAMHNLRIDFGLISVMPTGFYRASSSVNPKKIQLEPGQLIPMDDPQRDVFFPNLGNRTTFGLQEESAIQSMIERLTGVSEITLGVVSGQQGASRTATGTRALIQEANANLDVHLKRLFLGWKQSLDYLVHMLQQRVPSGLSFRVSGEDGENYWRFIENQQDIQGDFDFSMDPSSARSNPQVQQELANQIMQLTANPLDIQLGIITPGNRYNAMKNFLRSAQIKDFSKFITKPQGVTHIMTPEEEANRVLRGINVQITPEMDHEAFIDFVENTLFADDQVLGQFSQEQTAALATQVQAHRQMASALQAQQAQVQQLQQQAINAQTSAVQAPTAQNPLAGGGPGGA